MLSRYIVKNIVAKYIIANGGTYLQLCAITGNKPQHNSIELRNIIL